MALFTGLLMGSTWPLWTTGGDYPAIPWIRGTDEPPVWLNGVCLLSVGLLLGRQLIRRPRPSGRIAVLEAVLLGASLLLLPFDQHRLQPWVWQMVVWAAVIGVAPDARLAVTCLRLLTTSVYFWSAVSKLDWAFLVGRGQWLLEGLARSLGLPSELWSEELRLVLAAGMPAGELATAATLMWPRMRWLGLPLAVIMHMLLLASLGPWGHGQLPAVLLWNAYFIGQNVLLFAGRGERADSPNREGSANAAGLRRRLTVGITAVVCLLPALSPWGYWDHWPSWAVYSERPAVVQMLIDGADVDHLPASLRSHVGPPEPLSRWRPVHLDAWSFAARFCPTYPQRRYRVALVESLVWRYGVAARVVIRESPDRWTGRRDVTERWISRCGSDAARPAADR